MKAGGKAPRTTRLARAEGHSWMMEHEPIILIAYFNALMLACAHHLLTDNNGVLEPAVDRLATGLLKALQVNHVVGDGVRSKQVTWVGGNLHASRSASTGLSNVSDGLETDAGASGSTDASHDPTLGKKYGWSTVTGSSE